MYTNTDLIKLEQLTDTQLHEELAKANEHYTYVQSLYSGEEENNEELIPLSIIFMHLKNIENYIRRIENLLHEYEVDRVFILKAVNRRKKKLSRLA